MDKTLNQVKKFIETHALFHAGEQVVLGLSGGADSVFLLHALLALRDAFGICISCVHVNHGIRGAEARRDQAFCVELCSTYEVPCRVICVDVPAYARAHHLGLEEAARTLRYQALWDVCREMERDNEAETVLAVAHHAGDQAETVLHNLIRGSGLRGLSGMEAKQGKLVRPLLCLEKAELLAWLEARSLCFVLDSTNADSNYTRNRLRAEVMPTLQELNAQATAHINQTAVFAGEADDFLRELAKAFVKAQVQCAETAEGLRAVAVAVDALRQEKPLLRRYVFRELLGMLDVPLKDWGAGHLADLEVLLFRQGGAHLDLPCKVSADKRKKQLVLACNKEVLSMKGRAQRQVQRTREKENRMDASEGEQKGN